MGIEQRLSTPLAEAVRLAGGQSSFARMIRRNQSTVYDWLKGNKPLPAELCGLVWQRTGMPRWQLRPDLFEPDHTIEMAIDRSTVASDRAAFSDGRSA